MRLLIICLGAFFTLTTEAKETRCGWLENPSPANIWLIDHDDTWAISVQGAPISLDDKSLDLAYQAIKNQQEFVRTNQSYGFSCACLTIDADKDEKSIKVIYKAQQLTLKQCLEDTSITEHIPLRFK